MHTVYIHTVLYTTTCILKMSMFRFNLDLLNGITALLEQALILIATKYIEWKLYWDYVNFAERWFVFFLSPSLTLQSFELEKKKNIPTCKYHLQHKYLMAMGKRSNNSTLTHMHPHTHTHTHHQMHKSLSLPHKLKMFCHRFSVYVYLKRINTVLLSLFFGKVSYGRSKFQVLRIDFKPFFSNSIDWSKFFILVGKM